MNFAFRTAAEIVFGTGESTQAPKRVARLGRRALLVTGKTSIERSGTLSVFTDGLDREGVDWVRWRVDREPDTALADEGARLCADGRFDVILAVGGGSVMDAAKAVAALAANEGGALEYIEEVGGGRALSRPVLPIVAVPTTAGSGSEVTRNTVLRIPDLGVKRSIRSDSLLPRVAIVDPALSGAAPAPVAASAGLDALTHLIEAYTSLGAQPTTDALVLPGIRLALQGLRALSATATTTGSHEAMALASVWGGIALANAGLGAVHGLVAPLGGRCSVAHGDACGCLLPATLEVNVRALEARAPESAALARYRAVARLVVSEDEPTPARMAQELGTLRRKLGVKSLGALGVSEKDLPGIVAGSRAGSMKYNPIELTDEELSEILERSL